MESNQERLEKMNRYSIAAIAAVEAGKEIMKIYDQPFEVNFKEDNSPLTLADQNADDVISKYLEQTNIPILSEEGAKESFEIRKKWNLCWIVDPLDGTKEFIKKNGEFTVNIALVENGIPIFGVVFAPALGVMYVGEKGRGAYKVEIPDLFSDSINLSPSSDLPSQDFPKTFTIVGSRSHASEETTEYVNQQKFIHGDVDFVAAGSSLKFCLLAEGKAHVYPRFAPTMEWDTAAGQAVLEAAGGTLVEWPSKNPMLYNRENLLNSWFLAEAGKSE